MRPRTENDSLHTVLGLQSRNGPLAVRACLELVDAGRDMAVDDALRLEASWFGLLSATADMQEGTRAFLEKRKAAFTGS